MPILENGRMRVEWIININNRMDTSHSYIVVILQ
jgi:hypothetical protein